MAKTIKATITEAAVKKALSYIEKDPDTNIPKLAEWLKKYSGNKSWQEFLNSDGVNNAIQDKNNNWHILVRNLYSNIDAGVRKKLFETLLINASITGSQYKIKRQKKEKCNMPWAILMDPTSACNLHCLGCWAAEYDKTLNLTFEQLDDIICQGKKMGTYFYIYSGGEPLIRKKDIIKLCEKHQDCAFLAFTNATLIDEEFANEMLRVKNFVPAISIEGFEEETDFRRGKGTYQAIVKAMEILKRKKLFFGASCCYTSKNTDIIGSDEYFDYLVEKGAMFAWLFTYMPIGKDAVPELMVTAEQRKYMYYRIHEFRKTKSIFTLDFWNDGEYVQGCIAGGRRFLHINSNGDIEPCAFIHYSDSNIKDKTLLEAYKSPLFMQYHQNQPFNSNHLRPCPLLDNPHKIREMVEKSGAVSTDMQNPEDVRILSNKCEKAAKEWAPVADEMWECIHNCSACSKTKDN